MHRWPSDLDPAKCERAQRKLRDLATAIFTAALIITVLAAMVAYPIPYDRDLYNQIYANSRPAKGEDTYTFLFVFPVFLWLQGLWLWFDPGSKLVRQCQDEATLPIIWNSAGGLLFGTLAFVRIATVWRWYS